MAFGGADYEENPYVRRYRYQKMYSIMFDVVTDALNALDRLDVGRAKELLMQAQLRAEGEYLASGEEETQTGHRESRRPAALFG